MLTLAGEGVTVFGTGGADVNGASIAMNERVGYVIEERWVSLAPPRRLPVWKLLLGSLSGGFLGLLVVTLGFVLISLVVGGEFVAGRTVGIMKVTLLPGSIVSVLLAVGVAWPVVLAGERFEWVWRSRFWIAALAGVVCAATIYFGYTTSLTGSFPGVLLGGVAWFVVIIAGPVAVISATGGALAGALARRQRMLVAALGSWVFLVVLAFIMPIPMPPERYNSYEPSSQMRGLQNHRGEVSGGGFA